MRNARECARLQRHRARERRRNRSHSKPLSRTNVESSPSVSRSSSRGPSGWSNGCRGSPMLIFTHARSTGVTANRSGACRQLTPAVEMRSASSRGAAMFTLPPRLPGAQPDAGRSATSNGRYVAGGSNANVTVQTLPPTYASAGIGSIGSGHRRWIHSLTWWNTSRRRRSPSRSRAARGLLVGSPATGRNAGAASSSSERRNVNQRMEA
jgi:hypothetical protein